MHGVGKNSVFLNEVTSFFSRMHSYYGPLLGVIKLITNPMHSIDPCHFRRPWVTLKDGTQSTAETCFKCSPTFSCRQKGQLEKTAESPSQCLAQQDSVYQRSTTIYAVEIRDRHGSRSGAAVTWNTRRRWWWWWLWWWRLVLKMEGKTNFSTHHTGYRLSRTWIVECLNIIDVGCNLK